MFIRNTAIILLMVFCALYGWLNFDFVSYELASIFGIYKETSIDYGTNIISDDITHLFPIGSEKKNDEPKPSPKVLTSTNSNVFSFQLDIPILNIGAPIVFEPTTSEQKIYSALEKGVVHYAETPRPGQPGTSIIIGHSSVYPWYKGNYGYVFSKLSKLQTGDIINIENHGQTFSYKVSRSIVFSPTDSDDFALRELESTSGSSIVLMTCWPTGTNAKRVAVRADLII